MGLEFLGFELRDRNVRHQFMQKFPEKNAMQSLEKWGQFEEMHPDMFMGMYQFWCRKV